MNPDKNILPRLHLFLIRGCAIVLFLLCILIIFLLTFPPHLVPPLILGGFTACSLLIASILASTLRKTSIKWCILSLITSTFFGLSMEIVGLLIFLYVIPPLLFITLYLAWVSRFLNPS